MYVETVLGDIGRKDSSLFQMPKSVVASTNLLINLGTSARPSSEAIALYLADNDVIRVHVLGSCAIGQHAG